MRLNWKGWTYDLFQSLLRAIGVSGGAWLGVEIRYREINLIDLGYCILFGAVVRTLFHFLETRPLPEDLDVKTNDKPAAS